MRHTRVPWRSSVAGLVSIWTNMATRRNFARSSPMPSSEFISSRQHGPRLMSLRSTVEGYAKFAPHNSKWTKHTVAEHIAIGGNGPIMVGTPSQVADQLQTWVDEADVDGFNFVSQTSRFKEYLLGELH